MSVLGVVMASIFALADCNNFYVSCERVFQPQFMNKPVIVLSNNDGCVIARSNEVKEMGIPMGAPYFKIKGYVKKHSIKVFSSNYTLYGEMSARVMRILRQFTPRLEAYSIDEAFLDLSLMAEEELLKYGEHIRETILQWTGIPVSIGVAPTKTLAKVANKMAKDRKLGCHVLMKPVDIHCALSHFPIKDIWGVGPRWTEKLNHRGMQTALELSKVPHTQIRKTFNVVLARTVVELNGISALSLEEVALPKKNIVSSRSFGKAITSFEELSESIAFHASRIGEKLRAQASSARIIGCFISTNVHKKDDYQYKTFHPYMLPSPTNDTVLLIRYSLRVLKEIYKEGYKYIKAGVTVIELIPSSHLPLSLFDNQKLLNQRKTLMEAMDHINKRYGRGTLTFASEGVEKSWRMKRNYTSPNYLTRWDQILCVS